MNRSSRPRWLRISRIAWTAAGRSSCRAPSGGLPNWALGLSLSQSGSQTCRRLRYGKTRKGVCRCGSASRASRLYSFTRSSRGSGKFSIWTRRRARLGARGCMTLCTPNNFHHCRRRMSKGLSFPAGFLRVTNGPGGGGQAGRAAGAGGGGGGVSWAGVTIGRVVPGNRSSSPILHNPLGVDGCLIECRPG